MHCSEVKKQLGALSLGELPDEVRQTVQAHLYECAACRLELVQVDAVAGLLAAARTPPVPADFASRVLAAARPRQEAQAVAAWNPLRWWQLTSAPMHAAAAAVMVIGVAFGLMMGSAAPLPALASEDVQRDELDAYGLDYLGEAPADSLADNYLALVATKGPWKGGVLE